MNLAGEPNRRLRAADARPETELLLCCARTRIDPKTADQIRGLAGQELDWPCVIQTASTHGVVPLLYQSLNTTCAEAVPKTALERLRDGFRANGRRNLRLTRQLLQLLDLLESHGIPAVPYRGPVLAASVYGDISLRQFGDLDILVRESDVRRAKVLLLSRGYRLQAQGRWEASPHYYFVRDGSVGPIELHWRTVPMYFSFPGAPKHMWEHLESLSLVGRKVRNLSPEDLLVILCAHGATHSWERLAWICDVAELIRVRETMDWGRVVEQAGAMPRERAISLGLLIANDLLGTVIPEEVLPRVRADSAARLLATQVREQFLSGGHGSPAVPISSYFDLRTSRRLRDRALYCLRFAVTPSPPDRELLPLPEFLSFLYYLVRPIRLTVKYALHLRESWDKLRRLVASSPRLS